MTVFLVLIATAAIGLKVVSYTKNLQSSAFVFKQIFTLKITSLKDENVQKECENGPVIKNFAIMVKF